MTNQAQSEEDFIDAEVINLDLKRSIISDILWRTKDGRRIRVGDMEDTHLRNTAMFITGFGYSKCVASESVKIKWLHIFSIEWQRRMLARAAGKRIIRINPRESGDIHDRFFPGEDLVGCE